METKNRFYRVDRRDCFKTFSRRLGRSGRSNGNQALVVHIYNVRVSFYISLEKIIVQLTIRNRLGHISCKQFSGENKPSFKIHQ